MAPETTELVKENDCYLPFAIQLVFFFWFCLKSQFCIHKLHTKSQESVIKTALAQDADTQLHDRCPFISDEEMVWAYGWLPHFHHNFYVPLRFPVTVEGALQQTQIKLIQEAFGVFNMFKPVEKTVTVYKEAFEEDKTVPWHCSLD